MKRYLIRLIDNTNPKSLGTSLRRKRFKLFLEFVDRTEKSLKRPLRILDVGGLENFWEMMSFTSSHHKITILNLFPMLTKNQNIVSVVGDARNMDNFSNNEFDIVFSNSVIEHLSTFEDQSKMATEIKRLAPRYFIQTPSFYFPLEPHFLFPFFHWLPKRIRYWLVRNFSLGWYKKADNPQQAKDMVDEIRLLKRSELKKLFPDAEIITEKFLGLEKSYIIIKN